jgi:4-hydroxybenzoate polyprenyltransferase
MRLGYGLLRGCHPEPAATVTVVACVLAVAVGRGVAGTAAVGVAVLAGQLSIGWSNDWWDAGRDTAAGRADKPAATGAVPARALGVAAVTAAVATVPLSLLSGPVAGAAHLVAVGSAWLYNRPLKATAASVVPYLVSFGLLPAFVVLGLPGTPVPPWWLCAAGALLGGGAHFFNVLPDLAADRAAGVRGVPHRLGARLSWLAGGGLLLAASLVLAFGPPGPAGPYRLAALAVAVLALLAGAVLGRGAAFRTVLAVAVVDVALLVAGGTGVR